MTPKEKAQQLVDRFYNLQSSIAWTTNDELKRQASIFNDELGEDVEIYWDKLAKQTAVIAVDEIFNSGLLIMVEDEQYWHDVKQEIINLL
jgi:hypothetical protein